MKSTGGEKSEAFRGRSIWSLGIVVSRDANVGDSQGNFFQANPAYPGRRPGEIPVDKFLFQTHGFKDLCAPI